MQPELGVRHYSHGHVAGHALPGYGLRPVLMTAFTTLFGILPLLYATEEEKNPLCQIKLFTPDANWTWYIIEIDEECETCFGYVVR